MYISSAQLTAATATNKRDNVDKPKLTAMTTSTATSTLTSDSFAEVTDVCQPPTADNPPPYPPSTLR